MPKQQPGVPLPLEAVPHRDSDEGDAMAVVYCVTFEQAVQTAAYVTHAANAYPKLVEALRLLLADPTQDEALMHAGNVIEQIGEDV